MATNFVPAKTNYTVWRYGAVSGILYFGGLLLFWAVIGKFVPPQPENWTTAQVYEWYLGNTFNARVGMVGTSFFASWLVVWSCLMYRILERIEGPRGMLAPINLLAGSLYGLCVITFSVFWLIAAFRTEARTPEGVQLLHDLGYGFFAMTWGLMFIQMVAFGVVALLDPREKPLFPRWLASLAILSALTFVPTGLMFFYLDGIWAWHGKWQVVINTTWGTWDVCTIYYIFKTINRLEQEDLAES